MFRALSIIATIVALAVSVAPVASAGNSKKPPPRGTAGSTPIGEVTFPKARGADVINSLGQTYTVSAPKPSGLATRSRGETVSSDWVKTPPKPRRQDGGNFGDTPGLSGGDMSVRRQATQKTKASGLKAGIPDATSNTMMRSGSLKSLYGIIAILIG
jgi:hypothetical protein